MTAKKIEAKKDWFSLKIYINDILHLELPLENHDGVQSWYEDRKSKIYFIEFYRKEGNSFYLEYDEQENWKTVLKLIDENI